MKSTISSKQRPPRDLNLGVLIIFIIITIVFAISFFQSSLGQELFSTNETAKIGRK